MKRQYKHLTLLAVKYGPTLMALSCSIKCRLLGLPDTPERLVVNLINVVLDLALLGVFWIEGKAMGFCWKHEFICRLALYGYLYFLFSLVIGKMSVGVEYVYIGIILGTQITIFHEKDHHCLRRKDTEGNRG